MYKPYAHDLSADGDFRRESLSGRPSHGVFPYFNLAYGEGGCFVALGWPGCWRLDAHTEKEDAHTITRLVEEWRRISTYYYADFYTLTEWNNAPSLWRGYMYFDPARDAGFAQLFRPERSKEAVRRICFHGLVPTHNYHLFDTDGTVDAVCRGKELLTEGIDISLPHPLCAMVLSIQPIS